MPALKSKPQVKKKSSQGPLPLTNLDFSFLAKELVCLKGAYVENVQQLGESLFKFRLRLPGTGSKDLLVDLSGWLALTSFKIPAPQKPSGFAMFLRKHVSGLKIKDVFQHEFDRVIVIELNTRNHLFLMVELFASGNMVLCDSEKKIIRPFKFEDWSKRTLRPKQDYVFPVTSKLNPTELTKEKLALAFGKSTSDVIRTLVTSVNLGSVYLEEACALAGLDKESPASKATEKELDLLCSAILSMVSGSQETNPRVYGKQRVVSFELKETRPSEKSEGFDSLNDAVDSVFTPLVAQRFLLQKRTVQNDAVSKVKRKVAQQEVAVKKFEKQIVDFKQIGDLIYLHYKEVDSLLSSVKKARKKGFSYKKISEILNDAKEKGMPEAKFFGGLNVKTGKIKIIFP
ncbi:MAG: NFACT family protein [Candidatus Diapherotrites archaeon]|nr:NFACT family protein [Candidatus Diapherotrites archaeon]